MDKIIQELLDEINKAEEDKRKFVQSNPHGQGDIKTRKTLYSRVELARKALNNYKRFNPHLC